MPVHHSGARGASALRAAVDMAHEVQRDGDVLTLACDKSKDIARPEPISLQMVEVADSVVLLPSDRVVRVSGRLQANERAVLEALETFDETGAKTRQLVEVCGVPKGSLYRVLSSLKRRGYVSQAARGEPYGLTDAGRTARTDYHATSTSGVSWSPDDEPPNPPPSPSPRGDGDDSGDSSSCELSQGYGSLMPNYHPITGVMSGDLLEPAGDARSDYELSQERRIATTNYHSITHSHRPDASGSPSHHHHGYHR